MRLLLVIIYVALVSAVPKFHNEISKPDKQPTHERDELLHLKTIVQELTNKIADQDVMINAQGVLIEELKDEVNRQEELTERAISELKRDIKHNAASKRKPPQEKQTRTKNATYTEKKINQNAAQKLKPFRERQMRAGKATVFNYRSDFACYLDSLELSCTSPSKIFITEGIYGYYDDEDCVGSCCEPHPTDDCEGDVVDYDPVAWALLNAACNNQTSCEFEYQGAVIQSCAEPDRFADYMKVTYRCLPGDPNEVVAFTASTSFSDDFAHGDVIVFEREWSNLGGYYDSDSGLFMCPYNGLYQFTINIMSKWGEGINVDIVKDGEHTVSAYVDDYDPSDGYVYLQSGNTIFIHCEAGQLVWAECDGAGYLYQYDRSTTFSGVLLYRMDN